MSGSKQKTSRRLPDTSFMAPIDGTVTAHLNRIGEVAQDLRTELERTRSSLATIAMADFIKDEATLALSELANPGAAPLNP